MVILDLTRDDYVAVNTIGSEVIRAILRGESIEQLVQSIAVEYRVNADDVRKDVDHFLKQCLEEGLVEECSSSRDI